MKMRNLILLFALVGIVVFPGALCSHSESTPTLKVNVTTTMDFHFVIPAVDESEQNLTLNATVKKDIAHLIEENNSALGVEDIQSVDVHSVVVTLDNDSRNYGEDNLTAFESFEAYFSSNAQTSSIKVAEVQNPTNKYEVPISTLNNVQLKDYFEANEFTLELEAKTKRETTHELNATATVEFKINAEN